MASPFPALPSGLTSTWVPTWVASGTVLSGNHVTGIPPNGMSSLVFTHLDFHYRGDGTNPSLELQWGGLGGPIVFFTAPPAGTPKWCPYDGFIFVGQSGLAVLSNGGSWDFVLTGWLVPSLR